MSLESSRDLEQNEDETEGAGVEWRRMVPS